MSLYNNSLIHLIKRLRTSDLATILILVLFSSIQSLSQPLQNVVYSPDGSKFLVRHLESVYLWDSHTGNILRIFKTNRSDGASDNSYKFAAFLSNSKLVLNDEKEDLIWWDIRADKEIKRISGNFKIHALSPDRRMLAGVNFSSNERQFIDIYNSSTGSLLRKLKPKHSFGCMVFIPGNKRMLGISSFGAEVLAIETGRIIKSFSNEEVYNDCAVSPKGDSILAGIDVLGTNKHVSTWLQDLNKPERSLNLPDKYSDLIARSSSVGYSVADPNLAFVAGSSDSPMKGILIVWDISNGKVKQVITNENEIDAAAFAPNGKTILFLDRRRNLILLDLASGVRIRNYNAPSLKENLSIKY